MRSDDQGEVDPRGLQEEQPSRTARALDVRVSPKRAVSVYGLGRFPVTLYKAQWQKLLADAERLQLFIVEHSDELL